MEDGPSDELQPYQKNLLDLYQQSNDDFKSEDLSSLPFYSQLTPEKCRYQNKTLIGEGGTKTIYKVLDPKTRKEVALAKLHQTSTKDQYEVFLREAYLTAQLDHPNIISVYDIGLDEDGSPYYIMELKTGVTFSEIIKNHHKTTTSSKNIHHLLELFLKVCDAVSYAHGKNILHLDIKPENIQVGSHNEVILCDWGLGKVLSPSEQQPTQNNKAIIDADLLNHMTIDGLIKGTPEYMAPEQFSQSKKSYETDIYALGIILYFLTTGEHLCHGLSLKDIQEIKLKGFNNHDLNKLKKQVPLSLLSIIKKSIEPRPSKRYQHIEHLKDDLQNYITGHATLAEEANFKRRLQLFYLRNKHILHLGFLFSASVILIYLFTILAKQKENNTIKKDAVNSYYQKAITALSNHLPKEAQKHLQQTIQYNPQYLDSKNLSATLHFLNHDFDQASNMFSEHRNDFYTKVKMLNDYYLSGKNHEKNELFFIEHLLKSCREYKTLPIKTHVFLHFLSDKRNEVQNLALQYFSLQIDESLSILEFIETLSEPQLKESILNKVIETLLQNETWAQRRQPLLKAIELCHHEPLKNQLKKILPKNLALGQKVTSNVPHINQKDLKGIVDGELSDTSDCWNAGLHPAYIIIDLGSATQITNLHIFMKLYGYPKYDNKAHDYHYHFESSINKTDFAPLLTSKIVIEPFTSNKHPIEPTLARYIKVYITSNDPSFSPHVREVKVF